MNQEENRRLAQRYWSLALDPAGQPPIWEILADGEIRVVEIVEEIGKTCEVGLQIDTQNANG